MSNGNFAVRSDSQSPCSRAPNVSGVPLNFGKFKPSKRIPKALLDAAVSTLKPFTLQLQLGKLDLAGDP